MIKYFKEKYCFVWNIPRLFNHPYLSLEFGKTWSDISNPALEFSGFLLGLLSLHIVSVDTGLQLSKLIVKAKTCQANTPQTQNQEDRLHPL